MPRTCDGAEASSLSGCSPSSPAAPPASPPSPPSLPSPPAPNPSPPSPSPPPLTYAVDFGNAAHKSWYTLHGGAYIGSVDGTEALRVGGGKTAELLININPSKLPDCTIEVWFKLLSFANNLGWLVGSDNGGYDRGVILYDDRFGGGVAPIPGRTYNSGLPAPTLNQWSHVVVVYRQGGESVAFLNGVKSNTISPTSNNEGLSTVVLGSYNHGKRSHATDAWVRSVTIWPRGLTDDEISA